LVESNKLVKRLKVNIVSGTGSNGRTKTVKEITAASAANLHFEEENGTKHNVADYFSAGSRKIHHPYLPCISTAGKTTEYYPLEVCHVVPKQPVKGNAYKNTPYKAPL